MKKLVKMVLGAWPVLRSICVGGCLLLGSGAARAESLGEVEYIIAPRGAYIDTGYKPNQNTRVVMDVTVQGAGEYWFGCWDRNYNDGAFAFGNDGDGIYAGYGNQGGTFGSVVANGRHSVELDKNAVKVDGGQVHAFNAATFALANNLYLFAQNRNGEIGIAGAQTTIICHGCAIYDNGTLVRDFVPCTSPTGRTGLYDQIGQRFYALAVKLPFGYTAVEYIESTKGGGQFIDTGYTANGQTKVVMDAFVPARWEQNDRFGVLFGSRTTTDWWVKAFALQMCDGNTAVDTVRFAYNGWYRQDGAKPFSFGERVTVTCDGEHVEWTGSKAASVDFTADPLASSKSTLYIFADNTVADDGAKSETGLNHSVMRLYSFRITEGETPKRVFVPCVRTADAVAGLYDTVEGVFYENAGTGAFTTSASNLPFGRELASGTYEITESFAFVAPAMESALKIAEGATVTLNIPVDVAVTLRGGDAFEVWGAGAGIEVPANATLKVTGAGQLVAYGGKGANGCDGMAGGNGSADEDTGNFTSGAGGAGGAGGGGSGAGIGGRGGNGGAGGAGGASVTSYNWEHTDRDGNAGRKGGDGWAGGTCGTVSLEGTMTVVACGGAAGAADGAGGYVGERFITDGSTYYFGAYGGGGGGSGAKGGAAQDIGGGGAGGFGGGGGGSGAYVWGQQSTVIGWDGYGCGGKGANNGRSSGASEQGGGGGAAGAPGALGGSGSLAIAEFTVVRFVSGASDSYSVGRVSGTTEYIRWEQNHLYRVVDGVRNELSYSVVSTSTSTFEDGKWYVVKGTVSMGSINVSGAANLVLLRGASLTTSGGNYSSGVCVTSGNTLNIYGEESGSLTATGGAYGAGIGGDGVAGSGSHLSCGTVTINGGTVTAQGGQWGAGIGGGNGGNGGTVTINGGSVTAMGGGLGAGIGGGDRGAGGNVTINGGTVTAKGDHSVSIGGGGGCGDDGSLTLGPRVFKIDDNHWREGLSVSFAVPAGVRVSTVGADKTCMVGECYFAANLESGRTMTFTFEPDPGCRLVGNASLTVGPVVRTYELEPSLLPHAEEIVPDSLDYVLPDGEVRSALNVRPVRSSAAMSVLSQTWYYVTGELSRSELTVTGEVNLILCDDALLTVNGGIRMGTNDTLNIFCQRGGTGRLVANGFEDCAGIGGGKYGTGGTVTINGGSVTAQGGYGSAGIGGGFLGAGGTVTINGGTVTAKGGDEGAGIGGGEGEVSLGGPNSGAGGTVTINGGTVTATGGAGGAGIGGGEDGAGGTVTINGGVVTATGGTGVFGYGITYIVGGAGIGGGMLGAGGAVTINGGSVTAMGGGLGAGIGGGYRGAGGNVTINGGTVVATATGDDPGAGIGGGYKGADGEVTLGEAVKVIEGAVGNASSYVWITRYLIVTVPAVENASLTVTTNGAPVAGFAGGELIVPSNTTVTVDYAVAAGWVLQGESHFEATVVSDLRLPAEGHEPTAFWQTTYLAPETNEVGEITFVERGTNTLIVTEATDKLENGWYVVTGTVSRAGIDVASGSTVNLILADGASLAVQGESQGAGIDVRLGETLNIYGQCGGTGRLAATGGFCAAGIGGGYGGAGGTTVTINGGVVTATGDANAAGIGGGFQGAGGAVTVNGGAVTATGGYFGAGIGGGYRRVGGFVTIRGGTVTATGGENGAGIGGGNQGAGGEVTISGGTVTATGNGDGSGIGGGKHGEDGKVTLDETKVEVVEGMYGNGHPYVKIAEKSPVGPTCENGTIEWSDAANAWVITPNEGVTAVTIGGLPDGDTVAVPPTVTQVNGVDDGQIRVKSGTYDITGAFSVSGGEIALNPNGTVTIGGERIPVKPVIGELGCFDGEPFAVGENGVSITIRTIPGLFYGFRKGSSLAGGEFAVLVWAKAERTNLSFTDKSQPELAAFYNIEVRAYVEEPIQSDGSIEVKSEIDPETLTIVGLNVDAANGRVLLKVGAETTANVNPTVANLLNVTVRKGAEVTVKVEHAESPAGPWTELQGVGGMVTVDRAGADIEVKLTGELPAQGYFRARIVE